jgi:hypothetical protein
MDKAAELIAKLELRPHPEGGFYRETYRSGASTAIYYLLRAGARSRLHRIQSDELWHFYLGGPLVVAEISPDGRALETAIGPDRPQHLVPAGRWFGAYLEAGAEFALVGCTVAPPFRFEALEIGDRARLSSEFPGARDLIGRLCD